jgi:hypothetical protein
MCGTLRNDIFISAFILNTVQAAMIFNAALYRNRDIKVDGPQQLSGDVMASQLSAALNDDILFVDLDNISSTSDSPDGSDSNLSSGRSSRSSSISESTASVDAPERRRRRMTISELDLSSAHMIHSTTSPRSGKSSPRSGSVGDGVTRSPRRKGSQRDQSARDEELTLADIIGREGATFEQWVRRNLHVFVNYK